MFLSAAPAARPSVSAQPSPRRTAEQRISELAAARIAIEKVTPEIDGGRFPIKRIVGDVLRVEADIFTDGHDRLGASVRYRAKDETTWRERPMVLVDNDRWAGTISLTRNTRYRYTVCAWRDRFASWRLELGKKHDAGQPITLELGEGLALVAHAAMSATGDDDGVALRALMAELEPRREDDGFLIARLLGEDVRTLMARAGPRADLCDYGHELEIVVDRTAASFAAWYEFFPRSQSDDPARHGTFDDVEIGRAHV